jgi:hypothetical protein
VALLFQESEGLADLVVLRLLVLLLGGIVILLLFIQIVVFICLFVISTVLLTIILVLNVVFFCFIVNIFFFLIIFRLIDFALILFILQKVDVLLPLESLARLIQQFIILLILCVSHFGLFAAGSDIQICVHVLGLLVVVGLVHSFVLLLECSGVLLDAFVRRIGSRMRLLGGPLLAGLMSAICNC